MILDKKNMYSPKQENIEKLNTYLKKQKNQDIDNLFDEVKNNEIK